ncbi:MAG: hypothetical protein AAF748_02880 [Pseudomonadota bacterium]
MGLPLNTVDRDFRDGRATTDATLIKTRIIAGIWEGVLVCPPGTVEPPELRVSHLGQTISTIAVAPEPDFESRWSVRVAIPPEVLCDGIQTFLIEAAATGDVLARFSIASGDPLEDDIRAEVDLLRAELDMLKRAFRRHCVETQ